MLSAIKHDLLNDYIVSSLYKMAPSSSDEQDGEKFVLNSYSNVLGYLRDTCMPKRCKTSMKSYLGRKERALAEARAKLTEELNRVDIVRQLRLFQFAISDLLP